MTMTLGLEHDSDEDAMHVVEDAKHDLVVVMDAMHGS